MVPVLPAAGSAWQEPQPFATHTARPPDRPGVAGPPAETVGVGVARAAVSSSPPPPATARPAIATPATASTAATTVAVLTPLRAPRPARSPAGGAGGRTR